MMALRLHRGLETHDLAHYAVESALRFSKAFYGIINEGYNISNFELPKDQKPFAVKPENLQKEAIVTEHIVNLLEVEFLNSGHNDMFIKELEAVLKDNNLPFPKNLTEVTLHTIRNSYQNVYNQWLVLNEDQELRIDFKPSYLK